MPTRIKNPQKDGDTPRSKRIVGQISSGKNPSSGRRRSMRTIRLSSSIGKINLDSADDRSEKPQSTQEDSLRKKDAKNTKELKQGKEGDIRDYWRPSS